MDNAVTIALWVAVIGCYGFGFLVYKTISNHLETRLRGIDEKLYKMAKDVSYIRGQHSDSS